MPTPLKYDPQLAVEQLSAVDAKLARLMARVGPFAMPTREAMSPFQMLLHAIVYQQITTKAAASIHARLVALFPGDKPGPRRLQKLSDEALRGAGMSGPKQRAARDLADKALDGTVPSRRQLASMDDEAIIARLIQIRGIGQWSAEMMLIFQLGRPDVLPVTDLGVRKGFRVAGAEKVASLRRTLAAVPVGGQLVPVAGQLSAVESII